VCFCQPSQKEVATIIGFENTASDTQRSVENNIIISADLPEIKIKVHDEFTYIGNFDFEIIANSDEYPKELMGKPVAAGERFVFVAADKEKSVEKLFIVQFEGFLAKNEFIYNYNFDNAEYIGDRKYRHNTWFYNAKENVRLNPKNEGAKTIRFLENMGFQLEDYFMMSRFVGLASEDRKYEIIIFYQEMLTKTTGYSLKEYESSISRKESELIEKLFIERSRNSFQILEG